MVLEIVDCLSKFLVGGGSEIWTKVPSSYEALQGVLMRIINLHPHTGLNKKFQYRKTHLYHLNLYYVLGFAARSSCRVKR